MVSLRNEFEDEFANVQLDVICSCSLDVDNNEIFLPNGSLNVYLNYFGFWLQTHTEDI